ncbi:MAG: hypothetical protein ACJAYG_001136 [Oceanicoccus sp.]|jgi:hypothetical protein
MASVSHNMNVIANAVMLRIPEPMSSSPFYYLGLQMWSNPNSNFLIWQAVDVRVAQDRLKNSVCRLKAEVS